MGGVTSVERTMLDIPSDVETPAFVVDLGLLERNLRILGEVQAAAGCTILLALKGFAMWAAAPLVRKYLCGVSASSPHEARLGKEEFKGAVHAYAPAYSDADFREILGYCDHVILNSFSQWQRLRSIAHSMGSKAEFGIRINPEHREVAVALYDPCAPLSRLGATRQAFEHADFDGIAGLHFHNLCELGSDALERTLAVVEKNFAPWLERVRWVNMGGGHHITRPDYDREKLVKLVRDFKQRWNVEVFLEPGEAIAIRTGVLVASVLDVIDNGMKLAILDTSATAHMPDCLEMPYRPEIVGAGLPKERAHTYRLGGLTCLAGDVIGDYSFDRELQIGQKLVFLDMTHYTMVKTSNFNGVRLPSICSHDPATGRVTVHRRFGYESYRDRLS
jgi:carboxynorspermidine decarboxylase